jgi:hypothetical protein
MSILHNDGFEHLDLTSKTCCPSCGKKMPFGHSIEFCAAKIRITNLEATVRELQTTLNIVVEALQRCALPMPTDLMLLTPSR